jgi:CheY-like chemotaxis protein
MPQVCYGPADVSVPDPTHPEAGFRLRGERVLVVEDEPDTRELVGTCLERIGATVLLCASAEDALRQLADFRPHLLVSDLSLPQMSGLDLVRRLRLTAAGKTIPAVALTANASLEDAAGALEAGFDVHLTKPVSGDDLVDAVLSVSDLRREPRAG